MSEGHPRSDPNEPTILIDLNPREACAIAGAILWYLSAWTGPPTPLHRELRALALYLRETLPPAWRERMEGMLPTPMQECA